MYTHNLIAHRGTDNQILIEFVNQDQKAVDVTGKEFTVRLISHDGSYLLLEKQLTLVNAVRGQTKLVLTEQELNLIPAGTITFSIEQTADNILHEPCYVDDHAGGRGILEVVDSIMPAFVASKTLTIPDHGLNTSYVSSILSTDDVSLHTFQLTMSQFTGEVVVKGATDVDGLWYVIQTEVLMLSDLHLFNIEGYHPYLRFDVTETAGSITAINYR